MFRRENLDRSLSEIGARPSRFIFDELKAAYTEPGRRYHTDRHISDCLTHFRTFRRLAIRPAEVEVAFWFHDAVYDTRRSDNEERSAEWAARFLGAAKADQVVIDRTARLITATKGHQPHDADAAVLIDIDLGILGASPHIFKQYDSDIRREYQWVPDEQFRQGRVQVLSSFLERPAIYSTEHFLREYEQQARANLRRRTEELRSA